MALTNNEMNRVQNKDNPAHDWYRFVLSFPPHLVRDYCERFGVTPPQRVLDPFCGTGTVPVECKKFGIPSYGIEAHPTSAFASQVKTEWRVDPGALVTHAERVAALADVSGADQNELRTLLPDAQKLLITDCIGPIALHRALVLVECIESNRDDRFYRHELLAFAKSIVKDSSNLAFGPEVGVDPSRRHRQDAPVVTAWLATVRSMAEDLKELRALPEVPTEVLRADARHISEVLPACSVDAVITSPPYPNEKDYTRTTRLETVLLGFARDRAEMRIIKKGLVRSNTRSVYIVDDDDQWVAQHPEIQRIARDIEARRIELGKTSGFERLYARLTKLYFGGMYQHLADLRTVLRPGAQLAYVVGDQASYLQIMIRTGHLLADIGASLGYEVTGIDLFRTRLATATKQLLREEVVLLRWPG